MAAKHKKSRGSPVKVIFLLVTVIALSVMSFCVYRVASQYLDYHHSNKAYEKITADAVVDNNGSMLYESVPEGDRSDLIGIDWEQFKGTDVVAWVQLDDIGYPVYHDDGSQYYLRHLADGSYAIAGSIFLYGGNSGDFTDKSSFVYGHNMNNGSMFGKLKNYADAKYAGKKFYLYLPDGTRHAYQFYSVATVNASSQAYQWAFKDDASFENWQKWMKDASLFDCKLEPDNSKKYVTLSTCNGGSGGESRLIVCGQEESAIQAQEPASWYNDYASRMSESRKKVAEISEGIASDLADKREGVRSAMYRSRRGDE